MNVYNYLFKHVIWNLQNMGIQNIYFHVFDSISNI